jgi:AraC-like DNA-binding protein
MDRVRLEGSCGGVQRMRAWFAGAAFARHRHDTYAIGLTDCGVQAFGYRGAAHRSTRGDAVILHPDEAHDGYAGTEQGFGYRILYVDPSRVCEAAGGLPFVRDPVVRDAGLARVIETAFACELDALAADAIVLALSEALLRKAGHRTREERVDGPAVERARQLLDAARDRVVRSSELEAASGLSRFSLARQFRARHGTSPYRYSVMRRLEFARERLGAGRSAAAAAVEAGFADQAHFTRRFGAAFGLTPARYAALKA